jgi:hypothetical protein
MYQTEILHKSDKDGFASSVETYGSAQNYRCALANWTLISKKPKRCKHKSTTQMHHGDTIVMKNNLTGRRNGTTLHLRRKRLSKSFSALDADTGPHS